MCSHIVLSLRGEEKEAIESVSRDWQVNTCMFPLLHLLRINMVFADELKICTVLRKKKENGMSSSEKRGVIRSVVGGDHLPPNRDIDLHAFAPPLGTHPYNADGDDHPSGVAPNEGYPDEKYGGVHVDVELGVAVEEKRSSDTNAGAPGNSWNRNQPHGGA